MSIPGTTGEEGSQGAEEEAPPFTSKSRKACSSTTHSNPGKAISCKWAGFSTFFPIDP